MTEELKVTSGAEYRNQTTELFRTNSGRVFRIREPNLKVIAKVLDIFEVPLVADAESIEQVQEELRNRKTQLSADQIAELIDQIIPACIVEPRIVFDYNEVDDNSIHFDHLVTKDQIDVLFRVFELMELTVGASEEREFFRKQ